MPNNPSLPARPAAPGEFAVIDRAALGRLLKEHGALYDMLNGNARELIYLKRAARFFGAYLPEHRAMTGYQTRIAPFNIGSLAAAVTSGPSRVLLPRPSEVYGLTVGVFDSSTGQFVNTNSRFLLTRSNQDPLVVENLGATSVLFGVRPGELHGVQGYPAIGGAFGRGWTMNEPLVTAGNDELVLRARNEGGAVVGNAIHQGMLVYGEQTATGRLKLGKAFSKIGIIRLLNFTSGAGPLTFPFRRPAIVYGLAGFGSPNLTPASPAPALELSILFNNNDVVTTDFVNEQLMFGAGNTRGLPLVHPYWVDSNSALQVTIRNQIQAPAVAQDYTLVVFYDEEQ